MAINSLINSFGAQYGTARQQAGNARREHERMLYAFDPSAAINQTARSAFDSLSEEYRQRHAQRKANLNRRGLFGSDLGGGRMEQDFNERLSRTLGGLGMQGAQMEQNRLQMIGSRADADQAYAAQLMDALVGLTMTREQQAQANKASKRGMWGNIIGGIASAAPLAMMAFSDETLKEDIEPIEGALERTRRIRGATWGWNEKGQKLTGEKKGQRRGGVIAQEVEREFPEFVKLVGGTRMVDYGGLVGAALASIGELAEKVDALEGR